MIVKIWNEDSKNILFVQKEIFVVYYKNKFDCRFNFLLNGLEIGSVLRDVCVLCRDYLKDDF